MLISISQPDILLWISTKKGTKINKLVNIYTGVCHFATKMSHITSSLLSSNRQGL